MYRFINFVMLCCFLVACGGSNESETSSVEDVDSVLEGIPTFTDNPPEIIREQRVIYGELHNIDYTPSTEIKIKLNGNDYEESVNNYEVLFYVNTDNSNGENGSDVLMWKKRGARIFSRPANAENWYDYQYIYFGSNNTDGYLEFRINFFKDYRNKAGAMSGDFKYYFIVKYYNSIYDEDPISEDVYPDYEIYTNVIGLQEDNKRDYIGDDPRADILSVDITLNP